MSLDPDPAEMRRLGYLAVDMAVDWLARLDDAPVARMPRREVLAPLVREPLPRRGSGTVDSMERLIRDFLPMATLVNHPRFFAYVPCPGSFIGALGAFLAATTNLFTGSWLGGAVAAQLEEQTVDWVREAIGLTPDFRGCITSGGSIANLSALAAARSRIEGGADMGNTRIYVSSEAHHSLAKAARILGFPPSSLRVLPADQAQQMPVEALSAAIAADRDAGRVPLFVAATFGTTSTGAIDPIEALAAISAEHGAWFHVDGAYGAAIAMLPEWGERAAPFLHADSITLDPHKWLYTPFECGCLLTRDLGALEAAFSGDGDYMQDIPPEETNMFRRGPELSRGDRALKLWLLMRSVGTDAIRDAIREDMRLARLARDLLAADARVEIVTEPILSIFTFALAGGEEQSRRLVLDVLEDGFLMLSSSRVGGRHVVRFCVLNHRTTEADIQGAVRRILELIA